MKWYTDVIKNYAGFSGRASRTEYWMFTLINTLVSIILSILPLMNEYLYMLLGLYSLFIFVPSLAVLFRRLHDIGKSGVWFLIAFVPLVGGIVLLVFTVMASEPHTNRYGPQPYQQDIAS